MPLAACKNQQKENNSIVKDAEFWKRYKMQLNSYQICVILFSWKCWNRFQNYNPVPTGNLQEEKQ